MPRLANLYELAVPVGAWLPGEGSFGDFCTVSVLTPLKDFWTPIFAIIFRRGAGCPSLADSPLPRGGMLFGGARVSLRLLLR